jgi:hypothetical protein
VEIEFSLNSAHVNGSGSVHFHLAMHRLINRCAIHSHIFRRYYTIVPRSVYIPFINRSICTSIHPSHYSIPLMSTPVDSAAVAAASVPVVAGENAPVKSKGQLKNEKGKAKKEAAAVASGDAAAAAAAGAGEEGEEKEGKGIPAPWVMPEYMQHRVEVWDAAAARRASAQAAAAEPKSIKITLPDGKVIEGKAGITSPLDIAKGISNSLAERVIVAKVRDNIHSLHNTLIPPL